MSVFFFRSKARTQLNSPIFTRWYTWDIFRTFTFQNKSKSKSFQKGIFPSSRLRGHLSQSVIVRHDQGGPLYPSLLRRVPLEEKNAAQSERGYKRKLLPLLCFWRQSPTISFFSVQFLLLPCTVRHGHCLFLLLSHMLFPLYIITLNSVMMYIYFFDP